ncbi:hypothetical protein BYT27DRAFT_6517247 [Phlegmacium glaucopus]|nr:hypothetical protein BYT27DRAFT_6517247 [Phlegmacium glaucopus]
MDYSPKNAGPFPGAERSTYICYGDYKLALAFGAGPIDQVTRDLVQLQSCSTSLRLRTAGSEQAG